MEVGAVGGIELLEGGEEGVVVALVGGVELVGAGVAGGVDELL